MYPLAWHPLALSTARAPAPARQHATRLHLARHALADHASAATFLHTEADADLPALLARGPAPHAGRVHEWLSDAAAADAPPALSMFIALARAACAGPAPRPGAIVWIGATVHPLPTAVAQGAGRAALERSVFVRAESDDERLWAIDLALRSRACALVVADGAGIDMSASRRLQLAAEAGRTHCLLARPGRERTALSAAAVRWLVAPAPTPHHGRTGWSVHLLRRKGVRPASGADGPWRVEIDRATGAVALVADLADGHHAAGLGEATFRAVAGVG